ncbi:hypothetical protein [Aequorivita capsosiphonis]|uniref:hypothetical protein n=1 Tax=Aequorivita capsosiphonis TaxID=487317 RepID=UPI0003FEB2D8|nr:hypothetical protein [Aequorivita capsosiphonis]
MKKYRFISEMVVFTFIFLIATACYAQVGIGTTDPDGDALLELSSNDKGLLIPRVQLTATDLSAPLSTSVAGMLVYNTASDGSGANAVTPGFYYNDGTNWIRVLNRALADLTDDAWINNPEKNRIELGTLSDGTTLRPVGAEMVVTDDGKVGIGTETPKESIEVVAMDADLDMYSHGNDVTVFHIHSAGGTISEPTAVSTRNTSNFFSIEAKGYDGTNYFNAASFSMGIDGLPGASGPEDMPGRISFRTTQDGTTSLVQRMVIKNNGYVGIGTNTPKVNFEVNGMIRTMGYKVANLPAGIQGAMAYVTDASVPSYLAPVVGGGTVKCPVFYDGSNWVCH